MRAGPCPSACSSARRSPSSARSVRCGCSNWWRLQASENDVFTQIGLVMLIGLAAKNAILIVEFAKVEYEGGKPLDRCRAGRSQSAAPSHPHDRVCVHPRRRAARAGYWSRRARASAPRSRRPRRDAGCKPHRDLSDSGLLLRRRKLDAPRRATREAKTGWACARGSQEDRRWGTFLSGPAAGADADPCT